MKKSICVMKYLAREFSAGANPELNAEFLDACIAVRDHLETAAVRRELGDNHQDLIGGLESFLSKSQSLDVLQEIAMSIIYDVETAARAPGVVKRLAELRGVSRGHANRQIQRGRVLMEFQRCGRLEICPSGRKIEMLVHLPKEHWVPAWLFVLERAATPNGVTDVAATEQIAIYRSRYLEPQKPKCLLPVRTETPVITVDVDEEDTPAASAAPDASTMIGWNFLQLVAPAASAALKRSMRRGDPGEAARNLLLRAARRKPSPRSREFRSLLNELGNVEPLLRDALLDHACGQLLEELSCQMTTYAKDLGSRA